MKMRRAESVYNESIPYAFYKTLGSPELRPVSLRCIASIFYNFFFRQFRAAFLPGRAPISRVDHPLDEKIPFNPSWVKIYLDFVPFWVRMISFLIRSYGRKANAALIDFISSMGRLYSFAAAVYQKNFSTTQRPFFISRLQFLIIHLIDPHLMCIPSLHVMIAVRTCTKFRQILSDFGDKEKYATQIEEMRQGALAISRAILYIKQHSINCISAALYAICCFDPALFTPADAEIFINELFSGKPPAALPAEETIINSEVRPANAPGGTIKINDAALISEHIINLFRRFISEGNNKKNWDEPLLKFLKEMPAV